MIQVGGKIELSTKTKASQQPPMPPGVENNTKTQIGRLTKTVSSSGKVTYIWYDGVLETLIAVLVNHQQFKNDSMSAVLLIQGNMQVSLSSKSGNGAAATAGTGGRPAVRSGALPRSRSLSCNVKQSFDLQKFPKFVKSLTNVWRMFDVSLT